MNSQTIVGIGGFPDAAIVDYVLGFARGRRVLFDTTASPQGDGELPDWGAEITPFSFYPWPPDDLRALALSHDAILVCGGNTANMIAVWRVHGFDRILREAWEAGVVLFGWSAGMICWFEAGVTDSFGPQLAGMPTASVSSPAAPARTTTARIDAARSTRVWSQTGFPRESRSTTRPPPGSKGSSSSRWLRRQTVPVATT